MAHISEDDLENYAMRTLPEVELAPLEEHLLNGPECRDRLKAPERYLVVMRAAAATIRESGTAE